jgi:LysM repeat protein
MTTSTLTWVHPNDTFLTDTEKMNNAQIVANYFKTAAGGWVKEAISALCGNMAHESSLNPDMHELGYGDSPDRGYGLVQWTPMTKYTDWASANGLPWDDGNSQLARINYEVDNNIQWFNNPNAPEFDSVSFADFRSGAGMDVVALTKCFMAKYEHPNWSAGMDSLANRQSYAQSYYDNLDWTGSGSGGGTVAPSTSHVQTVAAQTQYQYEKAGSLNNMTYIQVKKGDSLTAIAKTYGVDINGIKKVSFIEMENKNVIHEGDILILPKTAPLKNPTVVKKLETAPVYYTVKSGDSLTKLAQKYNTTLAKIQAWNNIKNPNLIKVGQKLRVK